MTNSPSQLSKQAATEIVTLLHEKFGEDVGLAMITLALTYSAIGRAADMPDELMARTLATAMSVTQQANQKETE